MPLLVEAQCCISYDVIIDVIHTQKNKLITDHSVTLNSFYSKV